MKPIRILYALWSGQAGGSERQVQDLLEGMTSRGHQCSVLFHTEAGDMGTWLDERGITWFAAHMRHGLDAWRLLSVRSFLQGNHFDVIHEHGGNKLGMHAYRLFSPQSRRLFTIHNGERPSEYGWLRLWGEKSKMRAAHRLIGVSKALAEEWRCKIGRDDIEYMANAIDTMRFSRTADLANAKAPLVCVCRMIESKQHAQLLHWLSPILKKTKRELWLAGDGPERDSLEQLAKELGIATEVRFLGTRYDIPDLLASAALFVSASRTEAFPLSWLEAQACGLPVVVLDLPGFSEVVRHGETGWLVDAHRAATDFSSAVESLLGNPDKLVTMGQRARAFVQANYGMEPWLDKMDKVYASLLSKGCP